MRLAGHRPGVAPWRGHSWVNVIVPTGSTQRIDRDVLPVLRHLWEAGFDTLFSCQGGPTEGPPWPEGTKPRTGHPGYISFAHMYPPDAIAGHLPWPERLLRFTFSRGYGSTLPPGTRVEFPAFVGAG